MTGDIISLWESNTDIRMHRIFTIVLIFFSLLVSACTRNPFDNGEVGLNRFQVSGTLELSDHADPEGILVWLQGYNVGTYSDENGMFVLTLPPDLNQGGHSENKPSFRVYSVFCGVFLPRRGETWSGGYGSDGLLASCVQQGNGQLRSSPCY